MTDKRSYEQYITSLSKSDLEDIQRKIDQTIFPDKYKIVKKRLETIENSSGKEVGNKKELKLVGVFLGIVFIILWLIVFPIPGWFVVLLAGETVTILGVNLDLVGPPENISLGAVLTALLYVVCSLFIAFISVAFNQRYIASTIAIGSFATSVMVYIAVKNIMWL